MAKRDGLIEVEAHQYDEARSELIGVLARLILAEEDTDFIDGYEAVCADLALALELCPMHHCDYRICVDDDIRECAEVRGVGTGEGPWYCRICGGQIVGGWTTGWKHAGPADQGHGTAADAHHIAVPKED